MTLSEERLRELAAEYRDEASTQTSARYTREAEEFASAFEELLSLRSDAHTNGEVTEYDPDAPPDHSADNAADFIFKHLSDALGVDGKWSVSDGTETWDGDVAGTLYNILIAAGIWDNENGQLAGPIAWLVGWDENPYGMFARTETEANHVIANLNAYAKGVRTNLRAKPLFASSALSLGQGEAVAWRSVMDDPSYGYALARFFDNELGEWVYTTFREGPVRFSLAAPYTEWLPLELFNHPIFREAGK